MTVLLTKLPPDVWAVLLGAYTLASSEDDDSAKRADASQRLATDVLHYSYSLPMHAMEWDSSEDMATAVTMSGSYFFTPKTMRAFRSRVSAGLVAGRFFITSEQSPWEDSRKYTVRYVYSYTSAVRTSLQIGEVGGLGTFATLASARAYARRVAAVLFGGK